MRSILALALVLNLAACGRTIGDNKRDQTSDTSNGLFTQLEVANTSWAKDCEVQADGGSEQHTLFLQDSSFELRWSSFDGSNCNPDARRTSYVYQYVNVAEEVRSEVEGYMRLIYDVGTFTAAVHVIQLERNWTENKRFGRDIWKLNEPQEINGGKFDAKSDPKWPKGKTGIRNHAQIDGDIIRIINYANGTPQTKNPNVYKKQ